MFLCVFLVQSEGWFPSQGRYTRGMFLRWWDPVTKKWVYISFDGNGRVHRVTELMKFADTDKGKMDIKDMEKEGYYPHVSLYDRTKKKDRWRFAELYLKPYVFSMEQWEEMDVKEFGDVLKRKAKT